MPLDYTVAVFDLDNCLMDARAVGPLFEPAFEAVRQANQGALSPAALEQALQACWFTAFDLVAERHHFTPAMRAAGWQQFSQMEAKAPLRGYADIALLPRIPLRRYLVTSGFRRLQDSKIDALRIRPWFEQVLIDAIDAQPTGAAHGKQALFEQILAREGCAPRQMLVVGDNPLSELSAGRALGATTVQTVRPGVEPWPLADHRVEGLQGLLALLSPDAPRAAADTSPAGPGRGID